MLHAIRFVIATIGVVMAATLVTANLSGPPTGHTGAPGEGTCADVGCHDMPSNRTGAFVLMARSSMADDSIPYRLRLLDDAVGPSVDDYGFQLTVSDSLGQPFGELIVTDSLRTQVAVDSVSRQYLSHTAAGTTEDLGNRINWEFMWARPTGSLPGDLIRFNLSGVLADADGTPVGDAVVTDSVDGSHCLVNLTGDVNLSGSLSSADIIYLVGFIFKGDDLPVPCQAAGDVNCDAVVTSGDIIYLVNVAFKGGPAPCDVCPLILNATWDCF